MSTQTTGATSAAMWEALLSLSFGDSSERALVQRLLEQWVGARGSASAALYSHRDGYLSLEMSAGEGGGRFPERLEGPSLTGCQVVSLTGGALLHRPADGGAEGETTDALTLLLACSFRSYLLRGKLKEQHFQARYRGVELEALYDVGLAIASTLDLEQLCEEILLRAVSLLDARRGAFYLYESSRFRLDRTFGGEAREDFAELIGEGGAPHIPEDLLPGAHHLLALPITVEGTPRGMLAVADKESRTGVGPFPEADRRTLSLFANQAAIALETARLHRQALEKERLEREMELAAEIQRQILPAANPELPGFEVLGWSRPARQVGGDYYDLMPLTEDRLRLVVADVSGKGIPAALLVSVLHSSLRLLLGQKRLESEVLRRLNDHVLESSAPNKFITLFVSELDASSGELCYVCAGHNPALLLRLDGSVEKLSATGPPVGIFAGSRYECQCVEMAPGDLLCIYSDGITEAARSDDEELGLDRLCAILAKGRALPLDQLVSQIEARVSAFSEGRAQGDDQTLVLVRRHLPST